MNNVALVSLKWFKTKLKFLFFLGTTMYNVNLNWFGTKHNIFRLKTQTRISIIMNMPWLLGISNRIKN